jgi:hypothetical protein
MLLRPLVPFAPFVPSAPVQAASEAARRIERVVWTFIGDPPIMLAMRLATGSFRLRPG